MKMAGQASILNKVGNQKLLVSCVVVSNNWKEIRVAQLAKLGHMGMEFLPAHIVHVPY